MKKRKRKLSNLVMIAMILIAVLYLFVNQKNIYATADQLANAYQKNTKKADEKFLNKKLELSGQVKSFISSDDQPNILELKTKSSKIKIFCSFLSPKDDSLAGTLTYAAPVIISGTFKGIKNQDSPENIYIEVINIIIDQNK
ncbi:MAG: hypothetical protein KJO12_01075 [Ignavibacteria bacterium]|nr:hypothetical protein [Ignavibacteria bacterium]